MKLRILAQLAALLINTTSATLHRRDHDAHDYFALHLDPSLSPAKVEQLIGARHVGQVGELEHHHTFALPKELGGDLDHILENLRTRRRKRRITLESRGIDSLETGVETDGLDGVLWSEKLTLRKRLQKRVPPPPPPSVVGPNHISLRDSKQDSAASAEFKEISQTLNITDPKFSAQWHLFNSEEVGNDLNVTGVWLEGITGNGSVTAIVDDGLDMYSNDLKDNYFADGSFDFNDHGEEPKPRLFDDKHGTRCAGEVAAVRNDVCGVGVAYDSKVAGIRMLSKPITDEDEAAAINYGFQDNHIYSCSWGPVDDGATMDAPGLLIRRAMVNGVQKGRGGKGSVFVFAAGNGASSGDNCNFDGYTNSIYSITVGAIDRDNNHPYYSESCSAQLVVTYSSGGTGSIHTTDVGLDKCSSGHGGTSAAGPLVAGVSALVLGVRPDLTWRDLQHIMVQTAVPINDDEDGWQKTSIGKKFSHDYGYGKVDAYATVQLAKDWELVKPQAWFHSPWMKVYRDVPEGDKGLTSSFEVTEDILKENNLETLEHVTLTMNVKHRRRGDLSVELHSPSGIISYLSVARINDMDTKGYVDWTFMSVAHWGESGIGKWTVIVKDTVVNEYNGTFQDWRLNLWGEAIDANGQELHPLPDEHDHDHDTSVPASHVETTSIAASPTSTNTPVETTDAIDRPVNAKPTSTGSPTTAPAQSGSTTSATATSMATTMGGMSDSFLPSPFPTFGVSKKNQIWIYGSIALIIVFCIALGVYFWVQRRKRIRNNPRDDYEFEMVADDEAGFPLSGAAVGGQKQKRRGGELYDAFAGDSDEELFSDEEFDDDNDDDETESYHDGPSGPGTKRSDKASLSGEEESGRV